MTERVPRKKSLLGLPNQKRKLKNPNLVHAFQILAAVAVKLPVQGEKHRNVVKHGMHVRAKTGIHCKFKNATELLSHKAECFGWKVRVVPRRHMKRDDAAVEKSPQL